MKVFGLDVEMVEVEPRNRKSAARVSLVANNLQCIYDQYVRQATRVLCYKTKITGITKEMLWDGRSLADVRAEVLNILRNSIVVGHSIHYDLNALSISDNDLDRINCIVRDTTTYSVFRNVRKNGTTPSLKELAKKILGRDIQKGAHSSVIDARAALELYKKHRDDWEDEIEEESESDEYEEESEESDSEEYDDNNGYYSSSSSDY